MDIEAFADLVLRDPDGHEHRLGHLWAERPVVLVFLRHFG
jgi:hypothetical protein